MHSKVSHSTPNIHIDSWKDYVGNIGEGSISALFLAVCIFLDQADTYIEKLSHKADKKRERDDKFQNDNSGRGGKGGKNNDGNSRKRKPGFYKEESSDDSDSDEESNKPKNKRRKLRNESEFEEDSVEPESEEESENEGEGDDDSQWDSNCYICGRTGDVICCEGCPRVARLK